MTNIAATVVISLATNWVAIDLPNGEKKEVGVLIENRHARVIYMGKTNDYLQGSFILGQQSVRDREPTRIQVNGFNGQNLIWNGQTVIIQ